MKTVVYGLGISALSVLKKLKDFKDEVYVVNRGRLDDWQPQVHAISEKFHCINEDDSYDAFLNCDRIVLSPGIPRSVKWLVHVEPSRIISEIEFAFIHSDIPVIGITGSNGKTTTTTMIYEALKLFGKNVFVGGNIGIPYSDIIGGDYEYAVIELSSFQLESIQTFRPIISIITNLTPNHMERYNNFEQYISAKYNIYRNQNSGLHLSQSRPVDLDNVKYEEIIKLESFNFDKSNVLGEHNLYNFFCANEVCKFLCLNYNDHVFQDFINNFKSPKFRLEYINEVNNLKFYNDSKSTNVESTLKAVKAFEKNRILIIGGKLRDDNVDEFKVLKEFEFFDIYVFGEAKELLSKILNCKVFENLESVFAHLKYVKSGNVIFSPGFPSFDLYKNFEHRGDHFNELVASFKE